MQEDVFAWHFILNENIFLTDYILSETICLFCLCFVLINIYHENIYHEIKFKAKHWSDLCNIYSKVIFFKFCLSKYVLPFFA